MADTEQHPSLFLCSGSGSPLQGLRGAAPALPKPPGAGDARCRAVGGAEAARSQVLGKQRAEWDPYTELEVAKRDE